MRTGATLVINCGLMLPRYVPAADKRLTRPELLAEAIHNTRPEPELLDPHPPKIEKDRGG
jgi:hypothetical protein